MIMERVSKKGKNLMSNGNIKRFGAYEIVKEIIIFATFIVNIIKRFTHSQKKFLTIWIAYAIIIANWTHLMRNVGGSITILCTQQPIYMHMLSLLLLQKWVSSCFRKNTFSPIKRQRVGVVVNSLNLFNEIMSLIITDCCIVLCILLNFQKGDQIS